MPGEPTTVTGLELPVLFPDPGPLGMRGRTQRGQFHHQAQGFCHSCLRNAASRHPADGAHRASGRDPCRLGAVAPGSPGPVRPFHLAAVELHALGSCSGKWPACEEGAAGTAHPQRAGQRHSQATPGLAVAAQGRRAGRSPVGRAPCPARGVRDDGQGAQRPRSAAWCRGEKPRARTGVRVYTGFGALLVPVHGQLRPASCRFRGPALEPPHRGLGLPPRPPRLSPPA